ncbi:MAG: hypothetical protein QW409_03660, partial [Candidatus Aenigmatarchaeota archaeon]
MNINKNVLSSIIIFILMLFFSISFSEKTSISIELELKKGWNLISIPFSNYLIKENNCEIKSIYSFNSIIKGFQYVPDIKSLKKDFGYWIYVYNNCKIILEGEIEVQKEINLSRGWNLVSFYTSLPLEVLRKFCEIKSVFYFDSNRRLWIRDPEILEIGKGYWILTEKECNISLSEILREYKTENFINLTLEERDSLKNLSLTILPIKEPSSFFVNL